MCLTQLLVMASMPACEAKLTRLHVESCASSAEHLLLRACLLRMRVAAWRQIPRVELAEMGPALDLALRRHRTPAPDLEKEALKQAKLGKKKVPLLFLYVLGFGRSGSPSWAEEGSHMRL